MTSEPLSAWGLAQIIRNHRQIENPLHWTKDVGPNEADCGWAAPHAAIWP
ncbi:MAG: hypothetical protein HC877_00980 [Thioploca sp.]|nr:hypothetical protein [Thioploca sp.]